MLTVVVVTSDSCRGSSNRSVGTRASLRVRTVAVFSVLRLEGSRHFQAGLMKERVRPTPPALASVRGGSAPLRGQSHRRAAGLASREARLSYLVHKEELVRRLLEARSAEDVYEVFAGTRDENGS